MVKKPSITKTIRLNTFHWCGYIKKMEENRIPEFGNNKAKR
jgi:hypothetical protein